MYALTSRKFKLLALVKMQR